MDQSDVPFPAPSFPAIFPSITLPVFLALMDQTIVAAALPAIARSYGTLERITWIVTAYVAAAAIAAPVFGRLGDALGRRRLMIAALAAFAVGSAGCALSASMELLIFSRLLQGLGGGGMMTLAQALVGESVPPRHRARYHGYIAAIAVVSITAGPIVGGVLADQVGWEYIFLLDTLLALAAIPLILRLPMIRLGGERLRFDYPGLLFFALFIASALAFVELARDRHAIDLSTAALTFVLLLASCGLLIWREKRASHPLLPLSLLINPAILRSNLLAAFHGAAIISLLTFLPLYFGLIRGNPATYTGALLLPLTLGIGLGAIVAGRIVSQTGYTAIIPSISMSIVVVMLLFIVAALPYLSDVRLALILGVVALFMGTVMGIVQVTVQSTAGAKMLGAAAASVQSSRFLGSAVGVALVSAMLFSALAQNAEAARLFELALQTGSSTAEMADPIKEAAAQTDVVGAFRLALLVISGYAAIACLMAWMLPLRRI